VIVGIMATSETQGLTAIEKAAFHHRPFAKGSRFAWIFSNRTCDRY
jgi:hypothetical protein